MRKILRQTVEGGVGRNCRKYLDKPGTKFRLSISQSVDREVETNCRIVFCLVNPPTIKIPHLQYIATERFLELAAKLFALQIPIAFHDLVTSSLHCGFVLEFFETCICFFLCLDDIVNLCLSFLFQERQKGAEKMRAGLSPTN